MKLSKRRLRSFRRRHARSLMAAAVLLAYLPILLISLHFHPPLGADAATPTPAVAAPPAPGIPKRIAIPKLHLESNLDEVGLAPDRTMASPPTPDDPAWYELGPRPGAPGNAVIAGHLDGQNFVPAIFYNLHKLAPGDEIIVYDSHVHAWHFRVTRTQAYDARNAPLDQIFGPATTAHLNLITCAGSWDRSRQQYNDRLVVFAVLK